MSSIKTSSNSKIDDLTNTALFQADKLANQQKKSIEDSKPKLPLFDNMSGCLKAKVLSEGEQKFAS